MHEITSGRGQSVEEYTLKIAAPLGLGLPSVDLLPRREKYTRVYTIVYSRVHFCIPTCTLPRSKYIPSRASLGCSFLGGNDVYSRDKAKPPLEIKQCFQRAETSKNTKRGHEEARSSLHSI